MGHILVKAENGEAVIMEIKGKPLFASASFLVTPIPCCSTLKKFQTSEFKFRSRFCDITTYDDRSANLECTISYRVDSNTTDDILKAYKFVNKNTSALTHIGYNALLDTTTGDENEKTEENGKTTNSALSVTGVIGDCLVALAVKMTFKEMMRNKQWTVQTVFKTSKDILLRHGILLSSIALHDISLVIGYS